MNIKVLFVCLGNICRSPMAEAVFRHKVEQAGLSGVIEIDSAGTGDWHIGHPPHEGTRKLLDKKSISYKGMRARQVSADDFSEFQYIICMDTNNLRDVRQLLKLEASTVEEGTELALFAFMELLPEKALADVPDPYYTGNFTYVYELIDAGCAKLLNKIRTERKL